VEALHQRAVEAAVSGDMPPDVASKMRAAATGMEGERRKVVVMFSDVSGFTAMSEKMDPEQIHTIMNDCFTGLVQRIYKYEGYIDKFIGDCIMALFGAPISHEDDVIRALYAVLEMTEWLGEFSAELERKYGVTLGMHTGLNYGTVIAGGLGSDLRMDYTVIGDTVNVASRLESAAKRGQTFVSDTVYALGRKLFRFREVEPLTLKGKERPVPAFELLGVRDDPEPLRGVGEFPSVLVGRDAELELLRARSREAFAGKGLVVSVVGSPGVGKSRLISEFVREMTAGGVACYSASCLSYATNTPYFLVCSLTLGMCGLQGSDPPEVVRMKLEAAMRSTEKDLSEWEPYILSVVATTDDPQVAGLDGPTRQRMTDRAFVEFLKAQATTRPLVLVLDDLHWIDESSRRVLDRLVAESAASRMLLVCVFRPEFTPTWPALQNETRLALQPLDREAFRELLSRLLEDDTLADQLFGVVAQKSGGNPFFVEEVLQSWLTSGVLVRENGKWRLTAEPKDIAVPETLHAVIMGRLDALPEDARRLLQVGSVVGRSFDAAILAEMGWALAPTLPLLERLVALQLLDEEAPLPDLRLAFRQEFVQEVSYSTLLHRTRRQLHAEVGMSMERIYRDRVREHVEELAFHFGKGEDWLKAAHYTIESAKKAREIYANSSAIQHYRRLLDFSENEEAETRVRHQLEAYFGLGDVQTLTGDYDAALEAYEKALAVLDEVNLDATTAAARRAAALRGIGNVHLKRGDVAQSLDYGRQALDALADSQDEDVVAERSRILGQMGFAAFRKGQYQEAEYLSEQSLELAESVRSDRDVAYACLVKGLALYYRGNLEAATPYYQRALEVRERIGDLSGVAAVLQNLGNVYIDQAQYDKAEEYYRKCLAIREKTGDIPGAANVYNQLGNVRVGKGDYLGATECYTQCREIFERIGNRFGLAVTLNNLGQTHIEQGLFDEARNFLVQAEPMALSLNANDLVTDIRVALAHVALESHNLEEAASLGEAALASAIELGNKALEARSRWVLGRVACEHHDTATALAELDASLDIFRSVHMRRWEGRALVARGEHRLSSGDVEGGHADIRDAVALFNDLGMTKEAERASALLA